MYDTWNLWTGCTRCSEGCANCYMFEMEKRWGRDGTFKVNKTTFDYPIKKNRQGKYKVIPGSKIRVNMMSDTFLPEADEYRDKMWDIIAMRSDVEFYLLTKRPERIFECMPKWYWSKGGLENVSFNITCENQKRADERIPILRELPVKHKGIMCAPLISEIHIENYLAEGWIENVQADGERWRNARPCHYTWAKSLSDQCREANVRFTFIGTGSNFIANSGELVKLGNMRERKNNAKALGLDISGKEIIYKGVPKIERLWGPDCANCGAQQICNGLNPLTGKCD